MAQTDIDRTIKIISRQNDKTAAGAGAAGASMFRHFQPRTDY